MSTLYSTSISDPTRAMLGRNEIFLCGLCVDIQYKSPSPGERIPWTKKEHEARVRGAGNKAVSGTAIIGKKITDANTPQLRRTHVAYIDNIGREEQRYTLSIGTVIGSHLTQLYAQSIEEQIKRWPKLGRRKPTYRRIASREPSNSHSSEISSSLQREQSRSRSSVLEGG